MFLLGIIIWGGLALYIFIAQYVYRVLKEKLPQKKKYIAKIVLAVFILFPVYDIVITNILGAYYCLIAPPHPKTKIEKKVEYPISIYWEDNVYPGFSQQDRELMIINYLDGVHLKTMALNGPENKKIYVYHLDKPILKQLKAKYSTKEWYTKGIEEYKKIVLRTQHIYTKSTMPKTNYTVTFNEVKLNSFARKFLYSDETKVIDNKTNKVIAYNRRIMHFFYNIFPDFVGGRYYVPNAICGGWYEIHLKTFNMLKWRLNGFKEHEIGLSQKLYNKYIKGEK